MMGSTSGAGNAHPSLLVYSVVYVVLIFSFLFSDHSFFRFLFAIVLSVILRLMASDCPFGIFKLFLNIKHHSINPVFFHFSPTFQTNNKDVLF
jgi:hypothetical protein